MVRGKKRAFSAGKMIWFIFLVFLAFIATLTYKELFEPAANNPLRFANGSPHRPGRKIVICAGAAIVRGQVSFNYVDYLARNPDLQGFQFVNAGINSDLAFNLLQRLEPIISCRPAYILIQIGTDDLLGSLYPKLGTYYKWTKQLPRKPDLGWYRENLSLIVEYLKRRTGAKIALISLPMLGEAANSVANREVQRFNEIIQKIAAEEGVKFLPVYDQQVRYLFESQRTSAPEYSGDCRQVAGSLLEHLVFKKSLDEIARKNSYLLHSDGIHLNSRGGVMIAGQVAQFLKSQN
jgi:lysophospholipase L1-like esterase